MFDLKKSVLMWIATNCLLTALFMLLLGSGIFDWFWSIPAFFLLLGCGTCWSIQKMMTASNTGFVSVFMLSVLLKLLASIAFIALYVLLVKEQQFTILTSFLVYYITLLVFETAYLMKTTKKEKTNEKKI